MKKMRLEMGVAGGRKGGVARQKRERQGERRERTVTADGKFFAESTRNWSVREGQGQSGI